MKPNIPYHWTITLYGPPGPNQPEHATETTVGDIEHALEWADVLESNVAFEVHQFVITRGAKA